MTSRSYKSKFLIIVAIVITAAGSAGAQCVQPPDTTMVAWYPFDEPFGATTSADLAAGNTGTQMNGSLGISPGEVFGAACFNGANQYVQSASTIVNNVGPTGGVLACSNGGSACYGNFSIDTWIKIPATAPTGVMSILDKRVNTASGFPLGYHFFVYRTFTAQYLGIQLADGNPTVNYLSSNLPTLYNNTWQHVAVTVLRSGSNPLITFYLNGAKVGTEIPTQLSSLVNNSPLRIGTRTVDNSGWFQGCLDEFEIYNRDLTLNEVSNIFQSGPSGKCKPEQAWAINFGYAVSNSFSALGTTLTFTYWEADPSDSLTSVDVSIGSTSFGGAIQTLATHGILQGVNSDGFYVYKATVPVEWSGPGYLTLQNACTSGYGCSTNPYIYWEQYSGTGPATLGILGYTNDPTSNPLKCAEPDPVTGCPHPTPIPPELFF